MNFEEFVKSCINIHSLVSIVLWLYQTIRQVVNFGDVAIIERNFTPKFYIEHILKDLNLILDVAISLDVDFPIGKITQELYSKAVESGIAKEDYEILY